MERKTSRSGVAKPSSLKRRDQRAIRPHNNLSHLKLGEVMVWLRLLEQQDIEKVLACQRITGLPFGECCVRLSLITPKQLEQAVACQFGYSYPVVARADVSKDLFMVHAPFGEFGEALRAISNQLTWRWATQERKVLAITSAGTGDGRSLVAANLAAAFSQSGRRTLLIDGDLRNPRQHQIFGVRQHPGLSRLLSGFTSQDTAQRVTCLPNLALIPSGPVPPNPSELVARRELEALLVQAQKHYDVVVIDTPCSAFADAEIIASVAGSALIVAAASHTRLRAIQSWIKRLSENGVHIAGSVMNAIP